MSAFRASHGTAHAHLEALHAINRMQVLSNQSRERKACAHRDRVFDTIREHLHADHHGFTLSHLFAHCDRWGDGGLDLQDMTFMLRSTLRLKRSAVSDDDIAMFMRAFDTDGSSTIDIGELTAFVNGQPPPNLFPDERPLWKVVQETPMQKTRRQGQKVQRMHHTLTKVHRAIAHALSKKTVITIEMLLKRFDIANAGSLANREFVRFVREVLVIRPRQLSDAEIGALVRVLDDESVGRVLIADVVAFAERGVASCPGVDEHGLSPRRRETVADDAAGEAAAAQPGTTGRLRSFLKGKRWKALDDGSPAAAAADPPSRPAVDEVTRLDEAPGAPDRADGAEDPRPPEAPPAEAPDAGHGLSLAALPPLLELLSNGSEVGRNIAKEVLEVLARADSELEHGLEAELGDAELPEGTIGDRLTSFARSRGHTPNGSAVGGSYGVECHLEPDTFSPHGKGGLKSDWCRLPLEPDEFCEKF